MKALSIDGKVCTFTPVIAATLAIIITTRLLIHAIGMELDIEVVTSSHWQNLPLDYLATDLSKALFELHSQPPLWNLLLGLISKACEADAGCVLFLGHIFNISMTILGVFIILFTLLTLGIEPKIARNLAVSYSLLPSVVFYEHYMFYPHFTSILYLAQSYFLIRTVDTGSYKFATLAFACAAALCLTWSLFHPIWLVVIFATLCVALGKRVLKRSFIIPAIFALIIASLPSVKNFYLFSIATNGSWIGFNLSQVAPSLQAEKCLFMTYLKPDHMGDETSYARRLNNPDLIPISKECASLALNKILAEPAVYVRERIIAVARSMTLPSHRYIFSPMNWSRVDLLPSDIGIRRPDGSVNVASFIYRGFLLTLYAGALGLGLWFAVFSDGGSYRRIVVLFIPVSCFLLLAHGLNGGEQNRMRHTVEISIWILAFLCVIEVRKRAALFLKYDLTQ